MTEYDYSPEGYEKYMQTQARVNHWVHQQAERTPEYRNPFTYAPTSSSVRDEREGELSSRPQHTRARSNGALGRSASITRPHLQPTHSQTQPLPRSQMSGHDAHRSRSRSRPRAAQPAQHPQYYPYQPPAQYAYQPPPPAQPQYYISSAHRPPPPPAGVVTMAPPRHGHPPYPPPGPNVVQKYQDHAREVVLPPMRHGDRYMIVPSRGRQVVLVDDSGSSRTSPSSTSPTKGPLLKRIIKGLTPSIEWGDHSSSSSHRRSNSTRLVRGHSRRPTY